MISENQLARAASRTLKNSMALKRSETCLIVFDSAKRRIADSFFQAARIACREAVALEFTPRAVHSKEPPEIIGEAMKKADVIMIATSRSMSHTLARKNACDAGARIASMPDIRDDMLIRSSLVDYRKLQKTSRKVASALTRGSILRVTTDAGTDISCSIGGRNARGFSEGTFHEKGKWGNLPGGEVMISPVEGTSNGKYVIDLTNPLGGLVKTPITVHVREGYATRIEGSKEAAELRTTLRKYGKEAHNIAEIAFGMNPSARLTGIVLEDEKVLGTGHIATGDNHSFGGRIIAPCHLDGVFSRPTAEVDGRMIICRGKVIP